MIVSWRDEWLERNSSKMTLLPRRFLQIFEIASSGKLQMLDDADDRC